MAELLDEAVPAGELWRIVRSVRRCQEDGGARHPHEASSFDALARELVVELCGLGPKRDSWRTIHDVKENDDG